MVAVPDFDALVLDRLFVCNQEIAAASANEPVYRLPPVNAQLSTPLFYTTLGAMLTPVQSGYWGEVLFARNYIVVALLWPWGAAIDDGTEGADIMTLGASYPNKFMTYYLNRPLLTSDTDSHTAPLRYIDEPSFTMQDSGFIPKVSIGGGNYEAIAFSLAVRMRAEIDPEILGG